MADLVQYFSPVFSFGLTLEERLLQDGKGSQPCDQVYREIVKRLDAARAAALQSGKREQDVSEAAFAVVAWLDELAARYPAWSGAAVPLQVTLFKTANAGNEFFAHLNTLNAQQDEVREVYYLALCLGFAGQYYFDTGEKGELARLKETHGRQLPKPPAAIHTLSEEHVTPQPYLARDPGPPQLPRHWDRVLVGLAAAVAVSLALGLLVYVYRETPVDPKALDDALKPFECARLTAAVGDDNRVTVKGHVSRQEDTTRVAEQAARVRGVKGVSSEVQLLIWPYCEVVELLAPFKQRNSGQRPAVGVAPGSHGLRFAQGESLVLDLTAPKYAAYLYVDYYQLDGGVVHLFPNPLDRANFRLPKDRLTIGRAEANKRHWEIQPPFGQEMIAIMASPKPLFDGPREEIEKAKAYLPALRQRLAGPHSSTDGVVADYLFITTGPRNP